MDDIRRFGTTNGAAGIPVISQAVEHHGLVYLCGVTPDPVGDVKTQTREVLDRADALLARKSLLLSAQVWLADERTFHEHNEVWND